MGVAYCINIKIYTLFFYGCIILHSTVIATFIHALLIEVEAVPGFFFFYCLRNYWNIHFCTSIFEHLREYVIRVPVSVANIVSGETGFNSCLFQG